MVELVPSSDTLRKIQVEYGVTGSFKDKPLAEWLRKYNPAEDEYDKVSTLAHTHTKKGVGKKKSFNAQTCTYTHTATQHVNNTPGNPNNDL